MYSVKRAVTIDDLRRLALRRLPHFMGAYVETGAGDGSGARRNVAAFQRFRFVPRSLRSVVPVDTRTVVFGREYAAPFGISAVGMTSIYRRDADRMLAEVAREANIPFILSGAGSVRIEEIAHIAPDQTWFQMYSSKLDAVNADVARRARDAGVNVLVLTVDYPIPQVSQVVARTGISMASGPTLKTFPRLFLDTLLHPFWTAEFLRHGGMPVLGSWAPYLPAGATQKQIAKYFSENWCRNLNWDELADLRKLWQGKLVVKGIVHPEDVKRALETGVDAVTISNHGGNKLEVMQGSVDSLISVRKALGPAPQLFMDGGIRRGIDIALALALGANHCFIGRSTLYGVAAGGLEGARRAVEILRSEFAYTMAMIGCNSVESVRSATVVAEPQN
jgi:(S)-mandelate dehydrogenase